MCRVRSIESHAESEKPGDAASSLDGGISFGLYAGDDGID